MILTCTRVERLHNGRYSYTFGLVPDVVNNFASIIVWADKGAYELDDVRLLELSVLPEDDARDGGGK